MRISQPSNCEVTTKVLTRLPGQVEVSVALWHVFSLVPGQPDPEDPRIIWALAKKHGVTQLDEGYPKSRGEFLCFGTAYPPANLRSGPFEASVRVGDQLRRLAVFGRREFNILGDPRDKGEIPEPVAITPENAFGGKGFVDNPEGLGWQAKAGDMAPRVDDPYDLVNSSDRVVTPAGFWPLAAGSSLRSKHLGKFDQAWLKTNWPSFPSDTELEFFQTAPKKQRLPSYFKGNEACEIINMNKDAARLAFNVPLMKARCVYRRGLDTGMLHGWFESPVLADTLYVFPNEQVGALLHRCIILVSRVDALDLKDVLFTLEATDSYQPAHAIIEQLYQSQLLDVIRPNDEESQTAPHLDQTPISERPSNVMTANTQPIRRTSQSGVVRLAPDFEYILTQTDLKPETIEIIRGASDPFDALGIALKAQIQQARHEFEQAVRQSGLNEQEYLETLKKYPQVDSALRKGNFSGGLSIQIGAMAEFVDTMIEMLKSTSAEPQVSATDTDLDQTTTKSNETKANSEMQSFVEERRNRPTQFAGMNLSGLCLAGLSLAGLDFTDAICEATDFTGCDLSNACFKQATLTDAIMTGVNMIGADLTGAIASEANFNDANLSEANLSGATLNNCACRSTRFERAILKQTQLDQSDLTGARLISANLTNMSACECLFEGCDFTAATLDHTDFTKSTFRNCQFDKVVGERTDFSGAKVSNSQFSECRLKDCSAMLKAVIDLCGFRECDLTGMNWVTACVSSTTFDSCELQGSDFSSGELRQTTFIKSKVQQVSFFSCTLEAVSFLRNNLMQASFHGAKFNACSLLGNNLFGADFIETELDDKTTLDGNVTLNTILAHRGYPSAK